MDEENVTLHYAEQIYLMKYLPTEAATFTAAGGVLRDPSYQNTIFCGKLCFKTS